MGSAKTNKSWFVEIRGSYLPSGWQGYVIYCIYLAYIVALPIVWYQNGHDIWNLLVFVLPLWVAAALVAQYVASKNAQ